MATLDQLKQALRQSADAASCPRLHLDDDQYATSFEILKQGCGSTAYGNFIIPQLKQVVHRLLSNRSRISVLEIGPGGKSVLGQLPRSMRKKIETYDAFEPNKLFANSCKEWLLSSKAPLPELRNHRIFPFPFPPTSSLDGRQYDLVLLCHSMYGMGNKSAIIQQALDVTSDSGVVAVFHRESLDVEGLVCEHTASFPSGAIEICYYDHEIDDFAQFIAGFIPADAAVKKKWREICHDTAEHNSSGRKDLNANLRFSAPETMMLFSQHSTTLSEITSKVPLSDGIGTLKNREARVRRPAAVLKPTEAHQIQECVRWALVHNFGLSIVGGGHGGQCLWTGVVGIDMSAFSDIHILKMVTDDASKHSETILVAGGGCKTGDIIQRATDVGVTIPLGSRPSVGAGLWLQGGIGHLTRLHGLASDAILGAVMVSPATGDILYVGTVPPEHRPPGSSCPDNEDDILWALRGAGNQVAIVLSVVFRTVPAYTFAVANWNLPLLDETKPVAIGVTLQHFSNRLATKLPKNASSDAYIHWCPKTRQICLGVSLLEAFPTATTTLAPSTRTEATERAVSVLGPELNHKVVDAVGLFDAELGMLELSKGHLDGNSKTSAFKRCVFLLKMNRYIENALRTAMEQAPSPLCYLHLLHGGFEGSVGGLHSQSTAFGCRQWDFACVITGVWPRNEDGTETARKAVSWVYDLAERLLPMSCGAYGADLGPDLRDAQLAAAAFGPNKARLAKIKRCMDPGNVLRYVCPLPTSSRGQRVVLIVTGGRGAGKDHSALLWVKALADAGITARVVSISDATRREYAASSGADLLALVNDRDYKEQHRPALTAFYRDQVSRRPRLPEEHFLDVVRSASDVDVVIVTGMRDNAPVANFAHLVPESRVLEVRVFVGEETRELPPSLLDEGRKDAKQDYMPCLEFDNERRGNVAATAFAKAHLVPLFDEELHRLTEMATSIPDYPREGIDFRHVLNIAQKPGGLGLCASQLRDRFAGSWADIGVLVCCEAGGFIFATALGQVINIPLALIRNANKLPPPTVSIPKPQSHISCAGGEGIETTMLEMGRDVIPQDASVVVIDDVLATGETLCAALTLMEKAGVSRENMSVMVVAEFPLHQGRKMLRQRGFGMVRIQSLMVFGGM